MSIRSNDSIYPQLKSEEEILSMIDEKLNRELNLDRLNHMIKDMKILEEKFLKYKKIKKN